MTVSCNLNKVLKIFFSLSYAGHWLRKNLVGFHSGVGCSHAYDIFSFILSPAMGNNQAIHPYTLDLFYSVGSINHDQLLYFLFSKGKIFLLYFYWTIYAYLFSKLMLKLSVKAFLKSKVKIFLLNQTVRGNELFELFRSEYIKYLYLIKFSLTHQILRAWENMPYFRK